ncbi:hypothetical protein C8J57DRAFT_1515178 [Mycena rebaudengoi]|nr:hypothetical protein C8J57DRAFT_1515178 [Mycena rebaudengoi]
MSEWTQVKKKSRIGSKKSGPVEITGSAMIADDGGGQSPPPPPDRNTARVSLPSPEFSAARVADEVSYVLPTSPSIGRLTFGQAQSVGSIEPSTFLRPSHSANYTFPHVESPLAAISGSALDTDFTPLTPSIDRRATIEEMEKKHDREDGTSEPVALLKKLYVVTGQCAGMMKLQDSVENWLQVTSESYATSVSRMTLKALEAIELKLRGSNSEVERNAAEALAQIRRTDGVEALTGQATGSVASAPQKCTPFLTGKLKSHGPDVPQPGGDSSDSSSESSSEESDRRKPTKSDTDSVFEDKHAWKKNKKKLKKAEAKNHSRMSIPPGMTPDRYEDPSDDSSELSGDSSTASSSSSSSSSSSEDEQPAGAQTVADPAKKSKRSKKSKRKRNSRRKHHKKKRGESDEDLVESDPRSTGISAKHVVKWRASLHDGYRRYYKEMLGKRVGMESVFDEHKNLKLPAPTKYTGAADVAKFDEMVVGLFRWMQALNLGGKKNDKKRIITLGFYLAGSALEWFNDQVEGLYRVKRHWTFIEVILGLFDRFVDTTCIQEATEQFWHAKFSREIGIMGFYHELMTACRRMIKRPDSYTFKNHMLSRMPTDMVNHLIERNVTAECSSIRKILENATNYEYQRSVGRRYAAQRAEQRNTGPSKVSSASKTNETATHRAPERESRRAAPVEKDYVRLDRRPDSARVIPRETAGSSRLQPRDGGGKDNKDKKAPAGIKCYNCGGPHYKNDCPSKKKMFAARDIVDDVSDKDKKDSSSDEEPTEQIRHMAPNSESSGASAQGDLGGNQYSSSEEYFLDRHEEYSDQDNEERCAYAQSEASSDDSDTPINFLDVSDSEEGESADSNSSEFEDDDDYGLPPELQIPSSRGLFELVDDWNDEEYISDRDIDKLAKEMAAMIVKTGSCYETS